MYLHGFKDREIKEGDLAFEVFLEIEVAVSRDPSARDAFNFVAVLDAMMQRLFPVPAFEVVSGGYQ